MEFPPHPLPNAPRLGCVDPRDPCLRAVERPFLQARCIQATRERGRWRDQDLLEESHYCIWAGRELFGQVRLEMSGHSGTQQTFPDPWHTPLYERSVFFPHSAPPVIGSNHADRRPDGPTDGKTVPQSTHFHCHCAAQRTQRGHKGESSTTAKDERGSYIQSFAGRSHRALPFPHY